MALSVKKAASGFESKSTKDLQAILKKSPDLASDIQPILDERAQPRAFVTVEVLKNATSKKLGDGTYRLQATMVKAWIENPAANSELTYGFGDFAETAKISAFLLIPEQFFETISFAQGQYLTCQVGFAINPMIEGGTFVLASGTIPELRSQFDPVANRNVSLNVWVNEAGEEVLSKTSPGTGYEKVLVACYNQLPVEDVVSSQVINMALMNNAIPSDKAAWIAQANAKADANRAHNLAAYNTKRDFNQSVPTPSASVISGQQLLDAMTKEDLVSV